VGESVGTDSRVFNREEAVNGPARASGAKIFPHGESGPDGIAGRAQANTDVARGVRREL